MAIVEYTCSACRHQFPWFSADGPEPRCPRCHGGELTLNPWLLLSPGADGLTNEDHLETLLAV